ncbi:MAG: hypothetical protein QOK07_2466 [Gemmatimonadaceae bacterium]|nr:hypothetical protein [Gemmatimonadaceae bacterium]
MPEETISREVAISRIRTEMAELCDGGKSACQVAAERNILCRGFNRDSDDELRRRYAPYVGAAERISRSDLERVANHWHLARQRTEDVPLACDVQYQHHQVCRGWDDFSNQELSDFCLELAGVRPHVIDAISPPSI